MRRLLFVLLAMSWGCSAHHPPVDVQPPAPYKSPSGRNAVRLHVAEALLDAGKTVEAQQVLKLALEEGADLDEVKLLQGRALLLDGLYGEAENLLREAQEGMPRDPRPYRLIGVIQTDTGRADDAIASFQRATELDTTDAPSWNNLGFLLLSDQRYDEARQALAKAVALDGQNTRYRTNLGFALAAAGRPSEALQAFRGVGTEADAQANLGLAFELAGEPEQAGIHYRKALQSDPSNGPAQDGLTRIATPEKEEP